MCPPAICPSTAYELVNLYLTWNATKDIVFSASIDNLLNQYYRPYAIPGSSTDGTTQNDVLWSSPGPGRVYKAGLEDSFWRSIVRRTDKPIKLPPSRADAPARLRCVHVSNQLKRYARRTSANPARRFRNVYRNEPVPGEDWLGSRPSRPSGARANPISAAWPASSSFICSRARSPTITRCIRRTRPGSTRRRSRPGPDRTNSAARTPAPTTRPAKASISAIPSSRDFEVILSERKSSAAA